MSLKKINLLYFFLIIFYSSNAFSYHNGHYPIFTDPSTSINTAPQGGFQQGNPNFPIINIPDPNKPNGSLDSQYNQFSLWQEHLFNQSLNNQQQAINNFNAVTLENIKKIDANLNSINQSISSIQNLKLTIIESPEQTEEKDKARREAIKDREEKEEIERAKEYEARKAENKRFSISYFKIEKAEIVKENIIAGLNSNSYLDAEKQINTAIDLYNDLNFKSLPKNEFQKQEIKDVLAPILNEDGLIKDYLPFYPKLVGYKFKADNNYKSNLHKVSILKNINKALYIIKNSYSPSSIEKAEIAIENSLKADELLSSQNYKVAHRHIVRASSSLKFLSGNSQNFFTQEKLSESSIRYFDLNLNSNSYENYSIIELSNKYSKLLNKNFSNELLLHADLNLKESLYSSNNQDLQKFEHDLDKAWALVDFMTDVTKGTVNGLGQVVYDTLHGIYTLVLNPLDSALTISNAIYNYDHTWNFIVNKINQDIDNFPNLTTEQKAKFITESAVGIATLITPRSFIKNATALEKIAKASQLASARIVERYSHLIPANGYSPMVSGGGLFAHEAAKGGHLIQKHVGWSDVDLKNRAINSPNISNVSSFTNLNIAEQAVANTIAQNKSKIDAWLLANKQDIRIDSIDNEPLPVGRMYNKSQNVFSEVNNTRVVLIKDASFPEGYRILTGFPIR